MGPWARFLLMDTAQEREHLAHAEQQIAEFRQRVASQEAVLIN